MEDSSSDSSDEFLVPAEKLNLDDPFFKKTSKSPQSRYQQSLSKKFLSSSSDEESDEDENKDDNSKEKLDSAVLIAEVMKNLEKVNAAFSPVVSSVSNSFPSRKDQSPSKKSQHQVSLLKSSNLTNEINNLLLRGESSLSSKTSEETQEDNHENDKKTEDYSIPEGGVNIVLPDSNPIFKINKCKVDLETELIRKMNKKLRTNQIYVHKTGIICWLAHGFFLNQMANSSELLSISLSLIPTSSYPNEKVDLNYVQQFTKWFKGLLKIEFIKEHKSISVETLIQRFEERKVRNYQEQILMFVSMLRSIQIDCRLVVSLYPPVLKLKQEQLFQSKKQLEKKKNETKKKPRKSAPKTKLESSRKSIAVESDDDDNDDDDDERKRIPNSNKAAIAAKEEAKKRAIELIRGKFIPEKKASIKNIGKEKKKIEEIDEAPVRALRSKKIDVNVESKPGNSKKSDTPDDEFIQNESEGDEEEEIEQKKKIKVSLVKGKSKEKEKEKKKSSKVLSSSEDEQEFFDIRDGRYLWAEVYVETEKKWICVDVINGKTDCVDDIYKRAPSPMLYVVTWSNGNAIRDVTRRYCPHWLTVTRKQRVEEDWWSRTLVPWKESETQRTKAEDEFLHQKELDQPLPKTVGECKGHPFYVLQRHLLKFEALYPSNCVPLGYLKTGEAIYSRYCVHTLRSRETWLRQARVVKPNQEPYKIVKSLPKLDKMTGQKVSSMPLELFGKWQTMAYVPPEAKDGIVPRNEYGNVDLFQQCMLPKGTVHIDLPGLFRIAKKLNIDCCPAVIGFNFGARGAMPMTQGYIVCEEFEETLREAWENEQVLAEKREKEKREKKIWGNWRKLIRGLLIREKIALKYDMADPYKPSSSSLPQKRPKQSEKQVKKKQRSE